MSSAHGLTPDEGLARVMEAMLIADEGVRRKEVHKILNSVRQLGYHEGWDECFYNDGE